mmetsp:Transcript_16358/g.14771  ORF Transcript_16358/g.14771 Transcript_16358/m.14771 type:complete len:194 (-) Transcript_16358:267-848(-)
MLSESNLYNDDNKPFDDALMAKYLQELYDNESRIKRRELLTYLPSEGTVPRIDYGAAYFPENVNVNNNENNSNFSNIIYSIITNISSSISKLSFKLSNSNHFDENVVDDGLAGYYLPSEKNLSNKFYTRGQALVPKDSHFNEESFYVKDHEIYDNHNDSMVNVLHLLSENLKSNDDRDFDSGTKKETEMMAYM